MKLKKIFIILLSVMCVNLFYAQQVEPESKSESEFVLTDNSQKENPEKNFVFTNENLNAENTIKKTSSVWLFIRMILVLGVVVVCIYFVMNFMKKSVTGDSDSGDVYLRKVAQITLSPGKTVQVVTLLDKGYMLGVSESAVNLITEIDDKELISAMNISADKESRTRKARNFGEVLEMFMPSKSSHTTSATQDNIYSEASNDVKEFVKEQRKRINKNKLR
ncbi:MAG: flagellar biosynthetic protein FliO [Treponema sp.]|uniref:FliO/MopB family protein n=1 Tax=Treponema sp. TaxID=166 RepID=UPI001B710D6B|nr:flagellar biosynthetic protein FliO [Treponema sp.]MBP5402501.1 flagellar biosynthetic protein FliO [Treponema sp.]MBR5933121.1 flagellar biosynthetic protein FliO [Treponema sp.]